MQNNKTPNNLKNTKIRKIAKGKETRKSLFGCAKGVLNNNLNLNEFNSLNKEIANEFLGK